MRNIYKLFILFIPSVVISQTVANSLIKTEYEFAEEAIKTNIRDSFLKYIDEAGILFRPHPVNGREFLVNTEVKPGVLIWYPSFSKTASAGDLGVNTGPWEFKRTAGDASVAFGNFVTVWKRQTDGSWKFLIDMGNSNPKPTKKVQALNYEGSSNSTNDIKYNVGSSPDFTEPVNIEKNFYTESLASSFGSVYLNLVCDKTRLLRENVHYMTNGTLKIFISNNSTIQKWETIGGMVSSSNDLGYTYGRIFTVEGTGLSKQPSQYYLHVWVKDEINSWKLLIDNTSPITYE
ncbi:MAG: hypothetical protein JW995_10555 [Melioribacteraceae bacterium]|nr:hypothetical protein [Melioribacteraceae bacterium]